MNRKQSPLDVRGSTVLTALPCFALFVIAGCAEPALECERPCGESRDTSARVDATSDAGVDAGSDAGTDTGVDTSNDSGVSEPRDTGLVDATSDTSLDGGAPLITGVTRRGRDFICKLINERNSESEPNITQNRTHFRYNLRATDLGTPAVVGNNLTLFFGDSWGYQRIWHIGEDPDAVGYVSFAAARSDLQTLCRDLSFYVTRDDPSVAAGNDPRIERDFAGAYLRAPPGEHIDYYVTPRIQVARTATGSFAGSFEVPSGALGDHDGAHVFWATLPTGSGGEIRMTRSFVTRWEDGDLHQQILHEVDNLYSGRPLGGHFLQVAPVVQNDGYVYLFGTGLYRKDSVHLARKPSGTFNDPTGYELYDSRTHTWRLASTLSERQRSELPGVVLPTRFRHVGELGVQFVESAGLFVMMFQTQQLTGNHMMLLVSQRPEGPWHDTRVISMNRWTDAFIRTRCCPSATSCGPDQFIHCDSAGLYGIYPLPLIEAQRVAEGVVLEVPFVASTWHPYNVVLLRTEVLVEGI